MTDNETQAVKLERAMLSMASAGGQMLELRDRTPEEESPCGFDALHGHVAENLLGAPDAETRIMLVGMLAAGCMVDLGIKRPSAPPTIDGAFDVFADWGRMEGRSFGDLRRVLQLASDCAAEMYVLLEMMANAHRVIGQEQAGED